MLITTTNNIEGKKIENYLGIVCGEVIVGVNFVKDIVAGFSDIFGGRSATYEDELIKAREDAMSELKQRAYSMGANAVVGVDIDYEVLGSNNGMMMVSISGTAVRYID